MPIFVLLLPLARWARLDLLGELNYPSNTDASDNETQPAKAN